MNVLRMAHKQVNCIYLASSILLIQLYLFYWLFSKTRFCCTFHTVFLQLLGPILITNLNHFASFVTFVDKSFNSCVPVGRFVLDTSFSLLQLLFLLNIILDPDESFLFHTSFIRTSIIRFNLIEVFTDV